METTQHNDELEIDLMQLFRVIRANIVSILLSGLTVALLALVCTELFITPKYCSTAKMYVLNRADENSTITSGDMQSSSYLTKDYIELCKTRAVTEEVISRLGLDMTHEELLDNLSVSEANDTRVISISFVDSDPYVAAQIAESITDVASAHIQTIMEVQAVHTADSANVPTKQQSPNVKKNTLLGGVIGIFLAGAVVVVMFLINDTLRTPDEVERYLGLHVLGEIPLTEEEQAQRKKKNRKGKRR